VEHYNLNEGGNSITDEGNIYIETSNCINKLKLLTITDFQQFTSNSDESIWIRSGHTLDLILYRPDLPLIQSVYQEIKEKMSKIKE